jgi:arginine decarboxylase-like protein
MTACASDWKDGTVIITNNTNRDFTGRVWTDTKELYNGRIHAWGTKLFHVSEEGTVYTDFESSNGGKSNPSGYVSRNRTLILDL